MEIVLTNLITKKKSGCRYLASWFLISEKDSVSILEIVVSGKMSRYCYRKIWSLKKTQFWSFCSQFWWFAHFFVLSHSGHPHPVLLMDFVTCVAWPEEDCHGFLCYLATASTTIVPCSLFLQVKTHTEGQNKPFLTDNINIRGQNMTILTLMAQIKLKSVWEIHL